MTRPSLLVAGIALVATAAVAMEPPRVLVAYELRAGERPVRGISRELEWLFVPLDGERARMRLTVPVESFASGDGAFDAAFRKAVDAQRHPFVQIDGIAVRGRLYGILDFAGTTREVTVGLNSDHVGGYVVATGSFDIDLRDYGVILDGVEPHLSFDVSVRLGASDEAVLAGGYVRAAK